MSNIATLPVSAPVPITNERSVVEKAPIPTPVESLSVTALGTPPPLDLESTSWTDSVAPKPASPVAIPKSPLVLTSPAPVISAAILSASKAKSKKKKSPPTVTMATAPAAASVAPGALGENTGRWTAEEHRLFLQGLEQHGKGWKKIASLIKSRTVVQIRTHAQKYFQKLAKARQNGEEGDVAMEGRGGSTSVATGGMASVGAQSNKRRRHTIGTKRKAISSVVASAQRQGKKMAAAQVAAGVSCVTPPLPAVAPALAPFLIPHANSNSTVANTTVPSITTIHGTISGPALEDSLFRFLTPSPGSSDHLQVNEVARQVGAHPITLPSDNPSSAAPSAGGEISPTGVTDIAMFPSWTDVKDLPSWYAKGADIDCLLDVADTLDWLADTGDLHETYEALKPVLTSVHQISSIPSTCDLDDDNDRLLRAPSIPCLSTDALVSMDSDTVVPELPSLFENAEPPSKKHKLSSNHLSDMSAMEDHLNVFDTPMEEHAFVSALLENNGESSGSLLILT